MRVPGKPRSGEEQRRLNVAVIGASEWATTYHLPALKLLEAQPAGAAPPGLPAGATLPTVRLHGIWNRTAPRAEAAARRFAIPRLYRDLAELVDDPQVDCFVVLVNPKSLPEVVAPLLPRGLPLFTEKSPGWSYRQARELAEAVKVTNVVGFNRRYMPLNRRFKEIVEGMAAPHAVECRFYRHERLCEEFMIETGVHGINYLEYLCGPLAGVRTDRRRNPGNGTYLWECALEFASGLRGLASFLPCSGSSIERFEVHSNELSAYLHSPQTYSSDYPGLIILHRGGKEAQTIPGRADDGELVNAGFLGEYLDFFEAVCTGRQTVSNFDNACSTMRAVEAIEAGTSYRA